MKYLWNYTKKYRRFYFLAVAAMCVSIGLDMMAPQIIRMLIDDVITAGRMELFGGLLLGLIGIGLGRAVFQYVKEYTFDCIGAKIGCSIRKELFDHLQTLYVEYFDSHNTGELMARVKDDVEKIWNAMGFVGMLAIECVIHTVLVIIFMARISPVLTLLPLVIMPVIAWCAIRMESQMGQIYEEISEETARLNTVAQENLAGVRTVKAFARERYELKKFHRRNEEYYRLNMKQARMMAFYQPLISALGQGFLMAVVLLGGILVIRDSMTLGELGAFLDYANNIIWPMELVGWLSNDLAAAAASNRKIQKVLKETPKVKEQSNPQVLQEVKGEIRFEHVGLTLGDREILTDINVNLQPGKTLGIMGMTGSGKTSLVSLLQRFYDADQGRILLDGADIRNLSLNQLRGSMAVVMQDIFLFSDSVSQNIRTGQKETMEEPTVSWAADKAGAHSFIHRLSLGYDTVIGERGVGLSGGQKQRISIARALAKKTPVLILDDSTSALDMETEREIQQKLKTIEGVTKIIIGHRISSVKDADEILIMENGRIAERGNHKSLMEQRGRYYDTWCVQYGEEETAWQ